MLLVPVRRAGETRLGRLLGPPRTVEPPESRTPPVPPTASPRRPRRTTRRPARPRAPRRGAASAGADAVVRRPSATAPCRADNRGGGPPPRWSILVDNTIRQPTDNAPAIGSLRRPARLPAPRRCAPPERWVAPFRRRVARGGRAGPPSDARAGRCDTPPCTANCPRPSRGGCSPP